MYYFIGIKNEKMSALAVILHDLGYEVVGSDTLEESFTLDKLKERKIRVLPFNKNNIKENMFIVKGEEISEDNEEVMEAVNLGLNVYTYQDIVSKLSKMFQTITVAGSYGKTTTSAMMTHVLNNMNGVNYLIGDGSGFASKENKQFVIEAADYKKSFMNYTSYYAIITSIDFKHDNYFEDINDVISAYETYANNAEKMVIACGDDPYTHSLEIGTPIFYYGLDEDNDILAKDVEYNEEGTTFDVFVEDNYYGHFVLPLFGKHQLLDALAVIGVCYYERYEAKEVAKILKSYINPKRRFSETKVGTNVVIDDNAFYPLEIKATIKAVKQKYSDKNLVIVFDPNNGFNADIFKDDFINILSQYRNVYIFSNKDFNNYDCLSINIKTADKISINEVGKLLDFENTVLLFMGSSNIFNLEKKYIKLKGTN